MTNAADYYQILGVLHDAEQIVITAAYRALASMYHPDRWKGDMAEATRRMADINVAYGVIGDPVKRATYDKDRGKSTSTFAEESESTDQAFDQALSELEARWQTAVEVIPDLVDIRKRLGSSSLSCPPIPLSRWKSRQFFPRLFRSLRGVNSRMTGFGGKVGFEFAENRQFRIRRQHSRKLPDQDQLM